MQRHYCCYFDHRYLPRGLAMIRSLRRWDPEATFWVLCLSKGCEEALVRLAEPNVRTMSLVDLEAQIPELLIAKASRSLIEYYFTLTPVWVSAVLGMIPRGDIATYVDGDLFFFASPDPLYAALGDHSVSIIAHRFPAVQRHLEQFGLYNVGWLSFRNDERGIAVAQWWRARCIEWCFDRLEPDRYADQKYLDRFAALFDGVVVIDHPGANLAPWNVARHHLVLKRGEVTADNQPLIFFHYQGLRELGRRFYFAAHHQYRAPLTVLIRQNIYQPYLRALSAIRDEVAPLIADEIGSPLWRGGEGRGWLASVKAMLRPVKRYMALFLKGQLLIIPRS